MAFNDKKYIDASAGTGKTHWIVEEKLNELYFVEKKQHKDSDPFSRILIVTFTDKATGELRDRIRKFCKKKVEENSNSKDYSDVDVDSMHIFTIHSFCQRVLHDYSIHANQPSELALVDGKTDASSFVEKWIRDDFPKSKCFEFLKTNTNDFNKDLNKISEILVDSLVNYDDSMILEENQDEKEICPYVIYNVFESVFKAWKQDKANRKVQTFTDMISSVRYSIKNDPQLLADLQEDYDGVIIDEFQDTNGIQWEIFNSIFNNDNHFLYVVGDPKQSIFSFQGSDLEVYFDATDNCIGNNEELDTNWRSSAKMINACNDLFRDSFFDDKLLNRRKFYDSKIPQKTAERPLMSLSGKTDVDPFWFPDYEMNSYDFAKFAADRIEYCHDNLEIPDNKDDDGNEMESWRVRKVTYKDFAVLARTHSEMIPIENELKKRGIPYSRYKDKNLFSGFECQHWISLLNAIDADDFTGSRRKLLNEVLFSVFFDVPLNDVANNLVLNLF